MIKLLNRRFAKNIQNRTDESGILTESLVYSVANCCKMIGLAAVVVNVLVGL